MSRLERFALFYCLCAALYFGFRIGVPVWRAHQDRIWMTKFTDGQVVYFGEWWSCLGFFEAYGRNGICTADPVGPDMKTGNAVWHAK